MRGEIRGQPRAGKGSSRRERTFCNGWVETDEGNKAVEMEELADVVVVLVDDRVELYK